MAHCQYWSHDTAPSSTGFSGWNSRSGAIGRRRYLHRQFSGWAEEKGHFKMTLTLDGNKIATDLLQMVKQQNDTIFNQFGSRPRLAIVSIANGNLMTETALDLHRICASRAGCDIENINLPDDTSQKQLCSRISELNVCKSITAILVLQPLPVAIDVVSVINTILPEKEAEGLHPTNLARLFPTSLQSFDFDICVPQALKLLLSAYGLYESGKHWVILAQTELSESDIIASTNIRAASVGALPPNSTISLIAPDYSDARRICQTADGIFVTSREIHWFDDNWIKPGAIVVDFLASMVGERYHPLNPDKKLPLLKGSVNAAAIKGKAGYFAPVVGGVGPMLIGSLFYNCMLMHAHKFPIKTLDAFDVIDELYPPARIQILKRNTLGSA
ncbi:bifunctional 5,10-methylenetetrahydrofolate dehydrogenase/5,10-methenyltetrahydrofolate cyclohydrolase [Brucella pituitosa]|uniref:Bifunctional 5,10-methylenetetrahydrofolate dehydrogenase/5,10-methenyltetrahydrofolate cyclohydrolase n=2 Tax=Brucella pituitosa TaxID=571256 RepID=A0A643ETW1_9HYPH|nr:bifunctional 5,10-methylenetetrahydrofolate dehydrogenase/5,10-methenyltetrahydrofolate cyclohydrolase [Brucella pituitosa]